MKLLQTDLTKVEAYIHSNRLRNAYMIAIKTDNSTELIRRILTEADRLNQTAVRGICEKFLYSRGLL